ncbi:MAG: acyl-CoA dehydrogenase [Betaproteobacteria bacterium RIFCSPLOWO2_12_FULL_62_13]|nr:MAG: acyl-CoA dehydrogenase [Betaproteobacteria bacterium RIFCSPLOWO2_12_FULL_62_13]
MAFIQTPPELGNQYTDDRVLRSYLARTLPPDMLREIEPTLIAMGELAGAELYRMQLADRDNEPVLTQWDAWGNRVDRIEVSPLWREAERIAAENGLVAIAHERKHGAFSRMHQFALVYLFTPSSDLYVCPLAMTDSAACALVASGNQALIEHALPHLTSRDPREFWTSGQWMTEAIGGSDVGLSETVAREEDGQWRLYGRKWFTSAVASQMALTLARPEGNPPGGKGLALFYLETRNARGHPNRIVVDRLKDKLGTRKVPTAELTLEGTPAELVYGTTDGVKNITPVLNITRIWNSVSAVALMRRGLALARDYALKRVAFGAPLARKPLHFDTLAGLQAEFEGALQLTFFVVELLGRAEAQRASTQQAELLRLLTPVAKLTSGRQVVAVLSEVIESFGGAGYVEDTGLPVLLRDAQVLPIWEGTTNVLSLDALRTLQASDGLATFRRELGFVLQGLRDPDLVKISARVEQTAEQAEAWFTQSLAADETQLEAGARRFALTLGRTLELALLARHAQWSLDHEQDRRTLAAARRFAAHGINLLVAMDADDARMLARDE